MGNFVIQLPYLTSPHTEKTELCSSFVIKQLLHLVALFMATIHMLSVSLIEYFCYTFLKFFFLVGIWEKPIALVSISEFLRLEAVEY